MNSSTVTLREVHSIAVLNINYLHRASLVIGFQYYWLSCPPQTLSETTDGVVALVHGGKEYSEGPTPKVRRYVSRAVASGAFLVIGNHPHVAQVKRTTSGFPFIL